MDSEKVDGSKSNGTAVPVPGFVRVQLEEAQRKITGWEGEAEKVMKNLLAKGSESRKELGGLLKRAVPTGLEASARDWSKRAGEMGAQVWKTLDAVQSRLVAATGVASQSQVRELEQALGQLSKKIDALGGKRPAKGEARA